MKEYTNSIVAAIAIPLLLVLVVTIGAGVILTLETYLG